MPGRASRLAVVALWIVVASVFAPQQEIWVDETTQLSGLTLAPGEVVNWLAGDERDRFGVPGDRMPPVSYWAGQAWASVFGLTENSLRAFGILAVAIAVVLVMAAAGKAWGETAALIAGLSLVLSPNTIVAGVEIRAYPLFLLGSAAALWFLVQLIEADGESHAKARRSAWIGLAVACIGCSFTHFFGVVLSGAVLLAAFVVTRRRRLPMKAWFVTSLVVCLASTALAPFVLASADMSPTGGPASEASRALARLIYRTVGGHPAGAVFPPVLAGVLLGAVIAAGVALTAAGPLPRLLALVVAAGGMVVFLVRFGTGSFDPLAPRYNVWMLPAFALLISASVACRPGWRRTIAWTGIGLHLAGSAAATVVLLANGGVFAHTPADRLADRIEAARKTSTLAVVHDAAGSWGQAYYPLRYRFGPELPQYVAKQQSDGDVELLRLPQLQAGGDPSELRIERIVVIRAEHLASAEAGATVRSGRPPGLDRASVLPAFTAAGWRTARTETLVAQCTLALEWLDRPGP